MSGKTNILRTPSWFGDTSPGPQTNFLSTPSWLDDLVPPPSSQMPPLSTPDWLEGDMPAYAKLPSFERGPLLKRAPTPSSGDGRTPTATEGSTAARRTPDPFDDTPSPPMDMQFSNSSSHFRQLLAGAVAEADEPPTPEASERRPISQPQPLMEPPNGNWARPLIKPPMLLATAAPQNEAPGPPGPGPYANSLFGTSRVPPPMPVPLPPMLLG